MFKIMHQPFVCVVSSPLKMSSGSRLAFKRTSRKLHPTDSFRADVLQYVFFVRHVPRNSPSVETTHLPLPYKVALGIELHGDVRAG